MTTARARLRTFFASDWRTRDLIDFHTRHKLELLAHDPSTYRELGRIVAQAATRPRTEVEAAYRQTFDAALAIHPTRGRHTNALQHAYGLLSARLSTSQRHELLDAIENYRQGRTPLTTPLNLLHDHAVHTNHTYLATQTYLNPTQLTEPPGSNT